jgi:ABC-type Fe3+/spermidine/putrescine transport system ATPase subunit
VAENITYGLEVAKRPRDEVRRALDEALEAYRLEGLGDRMPHQLSGGQQQRVALARAMAMKPRALLMDEPLSNLDASLRKTLRRELLGFHRGAGNTIFYVTHDQEEALALADRIAVMMDGRIVETGAPRDLYERPRSLETALFLGDMNVFRGGRIEGDRIRFGDWSLARPHDRPGNATTMCIRPEHVRLAGTGEGLPGSVLFLEYMGTHATAGFDTSAGLVLARLPPAVAGSLRVGDPVRMDLPGEHRLWYPEAGA